MSIFDRHDQWMSTPPDDEGPCEVCGFDVSMCICEECKTCGVIGRPECYAEGHDVTHPMKRIFPDYDGPYNMGRSIYKHTDCGPWVAFVASEYVYDPHLDRETYREVYYEEAPKTWLELGPIRAIKVGSIVEGSDAEIGPHYVTVLSPDTLNKRFHEAVRQVNAEACEAWHEANDEEGEED